jgi:hypothetical protein
MYTAGEVLEFTSDGANWIITVHQCDTDWISAGAIQVTATAAFVFTWTGNQSIVIGDTYSDGLGHTYTVAATTNTTTGTFSGLTNPAGTGTLTRVTGTGVTPITWTSKTVTGQPVKGTTSVDTVSYRRQWSFALVKMIYQQTAAGAGVAGSGDYLFTLPVTVDTTVVTPHLTTGSVLVSSNNAGVSASWMSSVGTSWQNGGGAFVGLNTYLYSSTQVRFSSLYGVASDSNVDQSHLAFNIANLLFNVEITAPVSGWLP